MAKDDQQQQQQQQQEEEAELKLIKKIRLEYSADDKQLQEDLAVYRDYAIELGAVDSKVITTAIIPIDFRVVLKCQVPLCFGYGTSVNCPPYTLTPDRLRTVIRNYSYAIVFKLNVSPEVIVRNKATILERVTAYKNIFEYVSKIESKAFYDGYYLTMGFGAGSCKSTYCYNVDCAVLEGKRCRNELLARPSMEAVGIDVYRLATKLGWDIYPIGSSCRASSIPFGILMGIVLIAPPPP